MGISNKQASIFVIEIYKTSLEEVSTLWSLIIKNNVKVQPANMKPTNLAEN